MSEYTFRCRLQALNAKSPTVSVVVLNAAALFHSEAPEMNSESYANFPSASE